MHYYQGSISETEILYAFRHKDTFKYFADWLTPCEQKEYAVTVPVTDVEEWKSKWDRRDDAYTEYGLSVFRTSDYLLSYGKCVFHASALLWQSKAYLFTARSGTGKTTQLKNWMRLYPHDSRIMNGDKPVLSAEDGIIQVCPSPWKGKERLGDDTLTAPLGGIIFLEQGCENRISRFKPLDAAAPLLSRFLCTVENEKIIKDMCQLEDKILSAVPVWKLVNTGDLDSTSLVYETLLREISK